MKYTELSINTPDSETSEIFIALLSDYPFESFSEEDGILKAYLKTCDLPSCKDEVIGIVKTHGCEYRFSEMEDKNWNEVWESNFEPIEVEGRCLIRAPFHPGNDSFKYQIEIMPKMSFGTGHHATTYLMLSEIMDNDFKGLNGLDMGSGTGVLAILAVKTGALHMDAIDIDEWAYENSSENISANGVEGQVTPYIGDASLLKDKTYDFILANINRNILLADMDSYVKSLTEGGTLIVSGILEADIPAITEKAESLGLQKQFQKLRNGWAAVRFVK